MNRSIVELKRYEILLQSNLRGILREKDVEAAKAYTFTLNNLAAYAQKILKEVMLPDNWYLYCPHCDFEHLRNTPARRMCPQCGDSMKVWDESLGQRPKRRK